MHVYNRILIIALVCSLVLVQDMKTSKLQALLISLKRCCSEAQAANQRLKLLNQSTVLVPSKVTPLAERFQTFLSRFSRMTLTRLSRSLETPSATAHSMKTSWKLLRKKSAKSTKKTITDTSKPPLKMLTSMFTENT